MNQNDNINSKLDDLEYLINSIEKNKKNNIKFIIFIIVFSITIFILYAICQNHLEECLKSKGREGGMCGLGALCDNDCKLPFHTLVVLGRIVSFFMLYLGLPCLVFSYINNCRKLSRYKKMYNDLID